MVEEKEVWTNPGRGKVYIQKENAIGKLESTCINPGEKVTITPAERRLNQDRAYSKEQDLFTNGTLAAIKLIDTAADFEELAENPNIIADSEILDMFKLTAAKFKSRIAEIDNLRVLNRIKELSELDSTNATLPQSKAIAARIVEVTPEDTKRKLPDHTDGNKIKPIYLS